MNPVFVVGCGRSGTTLLASLLSGSSEASAPPEAQFVIEGLAAKAEGGGFGETVAGSWRYRMWNLPSELPTQFESDSPVEIMRGLAREYALREGKTEARFWIDHTPSNVAHVGTLLGCFEGARVLHIIRDPRGVAASAIPLDWGPTTPREAATWWLGRLAMGLSAELKFPQRVMRIRFEDLVLDPRRQVSAVCRFLGMRFTEEMITGGDMLPPQYSANQHALVGSPPDRSRIDAWRDGLNAEDLEIIAGELGDTPSALGYDFGHKGPALRTKMSLGELLRKGIGSLAKRIRWRSRRRKAGRS